MAMASTGDSNSLLSYLDSAQAIIDEKEDRNHLIQFSKEIEELKYQTNLLSDSLKINQAWQSMLSVDLYCNYSQEELLDLHGYPDGELLQYGLKYSLVVNNRVIAEFMFCDHQVYTPINTNTTHHCLRCA